MKTNSPYITFFGDERFSYSSYNEAPILQALAQKKVVNALVLKKSPTKSRLKRQLAVLETAKRYDIPVFIVTDKADLLGIKLPSYQLGIVASFGLLLPADFLDKFTLSLYNLHPSLLPLYRGVSPIEGALLAGATKTGMTLIRLNQTMDAGQIIAQQSLPIKRQSSKLDLTAQLATRGLKILLDYLPAISQKEAVLGRNQSGVVSYTQKIKATLITDFLKQPAQHWQRYIRAYQECPNNRFLINEIVCEILAAGVLETKTDLPTFYARKTGCLNIRCQKDYLSIKFLKPANRNKMSAQAFVNGLFRNVTKL